MELQTLTICIGVAVAGIAVLLLLVNLFTSSGTSYEEAIAQQRKAAGELLALTANKQKTNKKNKKAVKKAKNERRHKESVTATGSEPDSDAPAESAAEEPTTRPHVEFVDVPRDVPPNIKIRKRGKELKVKPILINKDDHSCISDASVPPSPTGSTVSNHFEEIHPKDEFELLQSSFAAEKVAEKKEEVAEKKEVIEKKELKKDGKGKSKTAKSAPPAPEPVKEEVSIPTEKSEKREITEAPKEQKKAGAKKDKKLPPPAEPEAVKAEAVVPLNLPQPSELTTEKLLKQVAPPQPAPAPSPAPAPAPAQPQPVKANKKNKKPEMNVISLMATDASGVNVSELVRLVSEAPLSRTEIQILTDALLNKQHGPLPQHSEWTEGPNDPVQKLKKQLAEKEKALAEEQEASQAVHAKLKELRSQLNAERSRANAAARVCEEQTATHKADAHALQVRLQRLMEENQALVQDKMMLQSKLGVEGEAAAQRAQLEMAIQTLSENEGALMAQLGAMQAEAGAHAMEAAALRDQHHQASQHAAALAQQLQEANRVCGELEAQRQGALHGEQRAQQEIRALTERLHVLDKSAAAVGELQAEKQRLLSRAQQAEMKLEKTNEELDKVKQQLSNEVKSLREQLAAKEEALIERQQMHHTQNGLPPNDQQKMAGELAKVESVVEGLRRELEAAQSSGSEQREQLGALTRQLHHYQDKNNELRTKNWKVMEALQSAEKALQQRQPSDARVSEAAKAAVEAQYKETIALLSAARPSCVPAADGGGGGPGRAWLEAFAAQLRQERTHEPSGGDDRLRELTAANDHLQTLVDKYKTIIDDTEGVLSRLQQNVTSEEARWAQQLAEKQRELDTLKQHTITQMQKKVDALEAELAHARAGTFNSLADSERLNEENIRLMAGIGDKHKLDSLNGPMQVGLEEK